MPGLKSRPRGGARRNYGSGSQQREPPGRPPQKRQFQERAGLCAGLRGLGGGHGQHLDVPLPAGSVRRAGPSLIPYLFFVALFGLVGLSAEFAIGRLAGTGTLGAYEYCWKPDRPGAAGLPGWGGSPCWAAWASPSAMPSLWAGCCAACAGCLSGELIARGRRGPSSPRCTGEFGSLGWHIAGGGGRRRPS